MRVELGQVYHNATAGFDIRVAPNPSYHPPADNDGGPLPDRYYVETSSDGGRRWTKVIATNDLESIERYIGWERDTGEPG